VYKNVNQLSVSKFYLSHVSVTLDGICK
jgi:hypothetical protein